jgi:hypothetical protein
VIGKKSGVVTQKLRSSLPLHISSYSHVPGSPLSLTFTFTLTRHNHILTSRAHTPFFHKPVPVGFFAILACPETGELFGLKRVKYEFYYLYYCFEDLDLRSGEVKFAFVWKLMEVGNN